MPENRAELARVVVHDADLNRRLAGAALKPKRVGVAASALANSVQVDVRVATRASILDHSFHVEATGHTTAARTVRYEPTVDARNAPHT